jgi:hypothetical protein
MGKKITELFFELFGSFNECDDYYEISNDGETELTLIRAEMDTKIGIITISKDRLNLKFNKSTNIICNEDNIILPNNKIDLFVRIYKKSNKELKVVEINNFEFKSEGIVFKVICLDKNWKEHEFYIDLNETNKNIINKINEMRV